MSKEKLAIIRVANACVLIELNGHAVLTDPSFTQRWYLRRGEPLCMRVADPPPVAAIATSFAANHSDLRALSAYAHKDSATVYVSIERMARQVQARARGYRRAEVMEPGQRWVYQ